MELGRLLRASSSGSSHPAAHRTVESMKTKTSPVATDNAAVRAWAELSRTSLLRSRVVLGSEEKYARACRHAKVFLEMQSKA